MNIEDAILLGVTLILFLLFFLCLHTEKLRKRFEPAPSKDRIFRCRKCAFVYTDDSDVDRSRCPHCGTSNESVKF